MNSLGNMQLGAMTDCGVVKGTRAIHSLDQHNNPCPKLAFIALDSTNVGV